MDNAELVKWLREEMRQQTEDFREDLASQTLHFDKQLADLKENDIKPLKEKVDPMYKYFITASTNMTAIKWIAGAVGSIGGLAAAWHFIKEFINK